MPRRYAGWEALEAVDVYRLSDAEVRALGTPAALFYTPGAVNTPRGIGDEIGRGRGLLHRIALESFHRAQRAASAKPRVGDERQRGARFHLSGNVGSERLPLPSKPNDAALMRAPVKQKAAIPDPTRLILIDEADRLKMASLEAARDLFDRGDWGPILIGMPGIEKRMARYPQFYSRIGFVREFRPLGVAEIRRLLAEGWRPPGITQASHCSKMP